MNKKPAEKWSARVTKNSNALDLEKGVFLLKRPRAIARSLKHSAQNSSRRKSQPYQSAMSMLSFYINRAGKGLDTKQKKTLERVKGRSLSTVLNTGNIKSLFFRS